MITLWCSPTKADSFSLTQQDKQLHFAASYAINYTLYKILHRLTDDKAASLILSSLTTTSLGLMKEMSDRRFSSGDMKANLLGVAVSAGFVIALD